MSDQHDEELHRRDYRPGYGPKHQIPTVQQYRNYKREQKDDLSAHQTGGEAHESGEPGHHGQGIGRWFSKPDEDDRDQSSSEPAVQQGQWQGSQASQQAQQQDQPQQQSTPNDSNDMIQQEDKPDTTESAGADPKERRKNMKKRKADTAEREVTDPVTHLPVTIRDFTDADLKAAEDSGSEDLDEKLASGGQDETKSSLSRRGTQNFEKSQRVEEEQHRGMEKAFPPPSYQLAREELARVYGRAMKAGLGSLIVLVAVWVLPFLLTSKSPTSERSRWSRNPNVSFSMRPILLSLWSALVLGGAGGIVYMLQGWVQKKAREAWEDSLWEAQRQANRKRSSAPEPEPTTWMNKLLSSIWPLINPDLFASLVDTLEDVMQASLPRMVRMVCVEDLGQGSESFRILGVKWLPHGAAGKSVSTDGDLQSDGQNNAAKGAPTKQKDGQEQEADQDVSKDAYNRTTGANDEKEKDEGDQEAAGLEAEDGEYVNLELAFAYRSSQSVRKAKDREKNAHLYMAFYLPGGVKFPVWVELKGLVGTMRMRMQLTPDPPFIALTTITFLGQPKVDISCTPLVKKGLNIMDVPLISNFVQSAVDAAMNEYVAPKSLTLDLKAMLAGDDFKHDTTARGVLAIKIHRAFDFKASDTAIPLISNGSSDPYVSVGWAKFGKPVFSTRVLVDDMEPYWEEETFLTVGPEELDAEESIRLQLWDSDRGTADDDLGRIEVDLKTLMKDEQSKGKLWRRTDTFEAMKAGETMPGRLEWSVGYFTKVRLLDYQVAQKSPGDKVTTVEQLKEKSYRESSQKLREANRDESAEAEQLKEEDFEATATDMITTSLPSSNYPSGILSLQIHQIVGLEMEKQSRSREPDGGEPDEGDDEGGEHLPDAYCTIILNHQKIFKTRTKPKNSKPFFNAGTERFIRDWRTTNIMISVRDARVHEDHPLLGIVNISLGEILRSRGTSRLVDFFPLAGGIGYGRARISLVFRSVQIQPLPQQLGWEWGTMEISPKATAPSKDFPEDLQKCRIKVRTAMGRGKLHHDSSTSREAESIVWTSRKSRPIRLAVRKRYSAAVVFEFRSSRMLLPDHSPAFAVLWLQNIAEEEEVTLDLPILKGDLKRAEVNVLPEELSGDRVGTLHVNVRFWRGLGHWHGKLAKKSPDVANVMECLVTARDNGLLEKHQHLVGDSEWLAARGHAYKDDSDDDDHEQDSDSSSDSDDDGDALGTQQSDASAGEKERAKANEENASSGKSPGGIIAEIKDYKRHKGQLHRTHKGMMQWKGPRTIKWLKGKAEHMGDKVTGIFEHQDRQPGVETEV